MFDEALKALKLRAGIMELSRGCMGRYSNTIIVFGIRRYCMEKYGIWGDIQIQSADKTDVSIMGGIY